MNFNLLNIYLERFYKRIEFCNIFYFFNIKVKCNNKIIKSIYKSKNINLFDDQYKYDLINNEEDNNNYILVKNRNKYIFNLLVNLCMRKGNKDLAYRNVKKTFVLLRRFFWINAMVFIKSILVQSESLFVIQKYSIGKREKVIPRFIHFEKKTRFVLRMLVKHAHITQKEYKYFYISLANAIIEYSLPNNILIMKNREDNELAELNKFFLFKKKKKRRKMRLFRKIDHWKE